MPKLPPLLIIDDDPDDLFVFRRLLAKGGVPNPIVAFEDAAAALEYLELESQHEPHRLPCAVWTDLHMPGRSGFEVVAWVRAQPRLRELPVLVISGSESPEEETRALALGATRFVRKYPSSEDVREMLGRLACHAVA